MVEIAVMNLMAIMLGHDPEKLYEEGLKKTEEERKFQKHSQEEILNSFQI